MAFFSRIVANKRRCWTVIGTWILLVMVAVPLSSKLNDVSKNNREDSLPNAVQSAQAEAVNKQQFSSGNTQQKISAIVVYYRPVGLTPQDKTFIARSNKELQRKITTGSNKIASSWTIPFAQPTFSTAAYRPPGQTACSVKNTAACQRAAQQTISADGSTALVVIPILNDGENETIVDNVDLIRKSIKQDAPPGLRTYVTGSAGIAADFVEVFKTLDSKLLLATVVLVLFLLLLIYRSPIVAMIPLLTVGFAYTVATALVYLMAKAGLTVNQQGVSLLVVFLFGAGTDYCLLLVARYREELHRHSDHYLAMQEAVSRAVPAIIASGLTVALSMMALCLGELKSFIALGPTVAVGILVVLAASITLLPAVLALCGRAAFWPRRHAVEQKPDEGIGSAAWQRWAQWVTSHPRPITAVCSLVLLAATFGFSQYSNNLDLLNSFRKQTDSKTGFAVLKQQFPGGILSATSVFVVPDGRQPVNSKQLVAKINQLPGVTRAAVTGVNRTAPHPATKLTVILDDDPYTQAATNTVRQLRALPAPPRSKLLVGGETAQQLDLGNTVQHDLKLIIPVTLLIIFLILGFLLRSVVAPLYLIATVILSFAATLGLSIVLFNQVWHFVGLDPSLIVYAWIFLIALGVDYNIFLMHRIRQEHATHSMTEAVARALSGTGSVITSAGLILAGTFAVLMTLPLTFLFQIGFLVSFGVLLDTFVVRTMLVPAIAVWVGELSWWPSKQQQKPSP